MKVVADTNVIISMLLWGKSLERIFIMVNDRRIVLCFSPETIDELFRVIHYPDMEKQAKKLRINTEALLDKLVSASLIFYPNIKVDVITNDPSDNRLLEAAYTAHAECIVSGDNHMLKLKQFRNIPIYSPAQFLQIFK